MPRISRRKLRAMSGPALYAPAGATEDALVAPWVAAVATAGATVTAPRRAIINTLASGLRADGLVAILDRLWLMAAATTQEASIDLIGRVAFTPISSPVFAVDGGYTADSSTGIDTNFTASSAGGHYTVNSASFGAYILNNRTTGQSGIVFGAGDGGNTTALEPKETSPLAVSLINGFASFYNTTASIRHSWVVTRTSSTDTATYQDNVATPFVADAANPSSGLNTVPFYIFSANGIGHTMPTSDVVAAVFIGGGLNATQAVALSNRINTYIAAIGLTPIW